MLRTPSPRISGGREHPTGRAALGCSLGKWRALAQEGRVGWSGGAWREWWGVGRAGSDGLGGKEWRKEEGEEGQAAEAENGVKWWL